MDDALHIGVLGATGMLGHHTARAAVAAGHTLTVFHRASSSLDKLADLKFTGHVIDMADTDSLVAAFETVDVVVHAAAFYPTAPRPWQQDVAEARQQINRFLDAIRQSGKRGVYVGGAIALKTAPPGTKGRESNDYPDVPASRNPYLRSKWLMDRLVVDAGKRGLPVSVAIPAMTFGEYDYGPSTGQLITRLANDDLPGYVRGERNVIYAGDAGRGIVAVAERGKRGERYLLTGSNTDMDTLVAKIAKLCGKDAPKAVPLGMAKLVSRWQATKHRYFDGPLPVLTPTAIAVMSAGQHLSGIKAKQDLGFEAEVSLDDTLARAYDWFKQQGMAA